MTTFTVFSPEVSASYSLAEKLETIFTTAVGGYLLVFVVLGIIWGILAIFSRLFDRKKPSKEASAAPPDEPTVAAVEEVSDEKEVVAVIAAAIAAYTDKPLGSFRVVSFRKKK